MEIITATKIMEYIGNKFPEYTVNRIGSATKNPLETYWRDEKGNILSGYYDENHIKKFDLSEVDTSQINGYYYIYDDGYLEGYGKFVNGSKEGEWTEDKINPHERGEFRKEVGVYKNNLREGIWKFYVRDKIDQESHYVNGVLSGKTIHYDSRYGYFVGNYVDGFMEGIWTSYEPLTGFNVINGKTNYKEGRPHGLFTQYFNDGTIAVKGEFIRGDRVGIWEIYRKNGTLEERRKYNSNNTYRSEFYKDEREND